MQEQQDIYKDECYALWLVLILTNKVIHRARQEELKKINLTVSKAGVLYYAVKLGDRATPTEISRCLFKKPHGISTLVSQMEKEGLVNKVNDLNRKNLVRVGVTEKGRKAYNQASKREVIHNIVSSLSEEESRQLSTYLKKLRLAAVKQLALKNKLSFLGYEE